MVPLATPDESAYLIAARVLAGGVPANFSYSTLYPAGYPLLIAPVYWFTHDPVTVYHAVLLGINAPISALIMPLGYVACRRLGLDRPWAFGVAMVAALVPAALFYSQYAMTDAIYPVLVAGLAARGAQLAYRAVRPGAVSGGGRIGRGGRVRLRGPLARRGDSSRLRAGGRRGRRAAPGAAGHRGGRGGGAGPAAGRGLAGEPSRVLGHVPERPAHPGGRGADQAAHRARSDLRAGDGRGSDVAVRPGRLGGDRARPGRRHLRDLPARCPGRGADHGRARGGGDAGHRHHLARRAAADPAAGLGLRALPGRHGGRVLHGRRRGAAARGAAPGGARCGVRGGADGAGRDRGARLRGRHRYQRRGSARRSSSPRSPC